MLIETTIYNGGTSIVVSYGIGKDEMLIADYIDNNIQEVGRNEQQDSFSVKATLMILKKH